MMKGRHTAPCCHCGSFFRRRELTLDHVKPRSQGGTYEAENVMLSCLPCNNERGDEDFHVFNTRKQSLVKDLGGTMRHVVVAVHEWKHGPEIRAARTTEAAHATMVAHLVECLEYVKNSDAQEWKARMLKVVEEEKDKADKSVVFKVWQEFYSDDYFHFYTKEIWGAV